MRYRLVVKPKAQKELAKLPSKDKKKILLALEQLKSDPFIGKKLEGELRGIYSLRVWPYRVLYNILRQKLIVMVIRVGHRQGVY
jgi:mRNA interferase RelE/StbE